LIPFPSGQRAKHSLCCDAAIDHQTGHDATLQRREIGREQVCDLDLSFLYVMDEPRSFLQDIVKPVSGTQTGAVTRNEGKHHFLLALWVELQGRDAQMEELMIV
jgi:hypothetical protein